MRLTLSLQGRQGPEGGWGEALPLLTSPGRPPGVVVTHLGLGLPLLQIPTVSHRLSRPDQHVRGPPPLPALLGVPPAPLPLGIHEAVEKDQRDGRELRKRRLRRVSRRGFDSLQPPPDPLLNSVHGALPTLPEKRER